MILKIGYTYVSNYIIVQLEDKPKGSLILKNTKTSLPSMQPKKDKSIFVQI